MATFGCMSMPFGCMSMARLGAKYAEVGCKVSEVGGVRNREILMVPVCVILSLGIIL